MPQRDGADNVAPAPDIAITFLRSLAPRQRQTFVSRMRQPEFAAWVRAVEALVSGALAIGAHAGDPALARSIARRLAAAVEPGEPLLLQLAVHALLCSAQPDRAPPDASGSAGQARARDFAVQLASEIERELPGPALSTGAGRPDVRARSAHAARRVGPRRHPARTPSR